MLIIAAFMPYYAVSCVCFCHDSYDSFVSVLALGSAGYIPCQNEWEWRADSVF